MILSRMYDSSVGTAVDSMGSAVSIGLCLDAPKKTNRGEMELP